MHKLTFTSNTIIKMLIWVTFTIYHSKASGYIYGIVYNYSSEKWKWVAQSCPTLCDTMDCSLPGSSLHGIFQTRVLEWVAISFSRGSSWPRDRTGVSHIVGRYFIVWATREVNYSSTWAYIFWVILDFKYSDSLPPTSTFLLARKSVHIWGFQNIYKQIPEVPPTLMPSYLSFSVSFLNSTLLV